MQKNNKTDQKIEKVVSSPIERAIENAAQKIFGKMIPEWMTPNMITMLGAAGGAAGIVFAFLAKKNILFLTGTCFGIITHLICDDLDGYVARKRNMISNSGAYLDLLTDILHITYLLIALSFSKVIDIRFAIFLVPVYALIIFTSMNEIHYLSKFSFPTLGPAETHLFFLILLIGSMVTGCRAFFTVGDVDFNIGNIVCVAGGVPMYVEMIRLQIVVFTRIRKLDK